MTAAELPFGASIRDLRNDDVDRLLAFMNPLIIEDTYIDMTGRPLTRDEEERFVAARRAEMAMGDTVMRVAVSADAVLATGELRRFPGRRRHVAELGVSVSARHRDRGLGTAMVEDLVTTQGQRLGVRRLVLRVFSNNDRAQQVYRNCGFSECGRIPDMVHFRGEDVDEVWMTRTVQRVG
jgi:RimJ/RimL family protein N-acetyltransferase